MNYGYNIFYPILSTPGLTWFYKKKKKKEITVSNFFQKQKNTNSHWRLVLLQHYASDLGLTSIWLYRSPAIIYMSLKCPYLFNVYLWLPCCESVLAEDWNSGFPSSAQLELAWSFRAGNTRWMDTRWVLSLLCVPVGTDVSLKNSLFQITTALKDRIDSSTFQLLSFCSPAVTYCGYPKRKVSIYPNDLKPSKQ